MDIILFIVLLIVRQFYTSNYSKGNNIAEFLKR